MSQELDDWFAAAGPREVAAVGLSDQVDQRLTADEEHRAHLLPVPPLPMIDLIFTRRSTGRSGGAA